jgi:hypothetical protein
MEPFVHKTKQEQSTQKPSRNLDAILDNFLKSHSYKAQSDYHENGDTDSDTEVDITALLNNRPLTSAAPSSSSSDLLVAIQQLQQQLQQQFSLLHSVLQDHTKRLTSIEIQLKTQNEKLEHLQNKKS